MNDKNEAWLAGADKTAHILAVLAAMSIVGPIEINAAKDIVRAGARKRAWTVR